MNPNDASHGSHVHTRYGWEIVAYLRGKPNRKGTRMDVLHYEHPEAPDLGTVQVVRLVNTRGSCCAACRTEYTNNPPTEESP